MQFKKIFIDIVDHAPLSGQVQTDQLTFMSLENFQHIATNLRAYTDTLELSLFNDPYYHPEFKHILDILVKLNYRCSLKTSSYMLLKHLDVSCASSSLFEIDISLFGLLNSKALDDDEVAESLFEAIVGLNGCNVIVSLIINEKDSTLVDPKIKDFLTKFDVSCSSSLWEKGTQIALDHHLYLKLKQNKEVSDLDQAKTIGRCYGTVTMVGCMVDGSIIPCNQPAGKGIILGNILEKPFHLILADNLYQIINDGFYKNHLDHPVCQHCPYPRMYF